MTVDFAKEYLLDDCADCPENKNGECMTKSHCFEVKRMAIQALEQTRWIPVSERLPEDGTYLVTLERFYGGEPIINIRSFAKDLNKVDKFDFPKHKCGWYDYDSEYGYWEDTEVIAWMPLPKPYEPQESEDGKCHIV